MNLTGVLVPAVMYKLSLIHQQVKINLGKIHNGQMTWQMKLKMLIKKYVSIRILDIIFIVIPFFI
jgi:hypothetical protein